ncbi:MAG: hypothetical protein V7603_4037 [Micromonosporaceae bacterium]
MISKVKRIGVAVAAAASVQLIVPAGALAAPPAPEVSAHLAVQRDPSLPGVAVPGPAPVRRVTGRPYAAEAPRWPSGSAVVGLTGTPRRAGTLPVSVRAGGAAARASSGAGPAVRVDVADRAATAAAGVRGLIVRLSGPATAVAVHLDVDYTGFRDGFSGGAAAALGLVRLTGCVPVTAACTVTPLASTDNVAAGVLSADVVADATVAVVEEPNGPAGDYTATPLKATSTWQAGGNSGDFTWQYPLRVPPAPGGPEPDLSLAYSAQSVDGQMAASNNQPSWLGEGFGMATGAIERKYVPCGKDMGGTANNTTKTGDKCWKTDNATLTLNGAATELLKGVDGRWHGRTEDGSRIELKTGAANGDHDGQWWVVTATDGTQYWFGRNQLPGWASGKAVTNSVWTVPVFGNNTGEPCHVAAFSGSACDRAWRWNLDYVVDPFGNTMSYWYGVEKNQYAKAGSATTLATYTRGGWLDRIDYGTRSDTAYGTAPTQVDFGEADRCVTSSCATHNVQNWPDTPWTMECTKSPCTVGSPTFWTAKRLGTLTTRSGGKPVDQWTFTQSFPDPGDTTRAGLWLDSISHKGLAGTTDGTRTAVTVPDVHFVGVQKPNRVDATDTAPAMNWWRIASVETETGGSVNVTYSDADCVRGSRMPDTAALDANTLRCFPVYWIPDGATDLKLDFFHKYVVTTVTESDLGLPSDERSVPTVTHYEYLTAPAWRYTDDDGLVDDKAKTWSVWRGYGRMRTTVGQGAEAVRSESVYFRGMDGDKLRTGNRSVTLSAAGGAPAVTDSDFYAGMIRERLSYQDATGSEISATVNVPWRSDPPTATRTVDGVRAEARFVGVAENHGRTALDGGRGWRTTTTLQTFDSSGMVIREEDLGDDSVTDDQTCTLTDYARNATAWITDSVSRRRQFAVDCTKAQGTGLTEADVVSDSYTRYDGGARGAAPTKGAVTETDELAGYPSRYIVESKATYDGYGRVLAATDVRGNTTTTTYTPTAGGPVTGTQVVTQLGWKTTTTLDPAWGVPTNTVDPNGKSTRQTYDALGRATAVWLPNRPSNLSASTVYGYQVRKTGGTVTVTGKLNTTGDGYRSSAEFFDGQGRSRQIQSMEGTTAGGRIVSDTFYDSAGRTAKQNSAYLVDGGLAVGNPVLVAHPDDAQVPSQTVTAYDGAGRVVRTALNVNGAEKWHTTTGFGGDRTDVTPPAGSMPSSTYADAQGRTTRLRQFHSAPGGSDYNDVTYSYDRKGRKTAEHDNVDNAWTYGYDFLGHQTSAAEPDAGATQKTYNDAGDLLSTTNAEGKTLVYGYDSIGRKTSERRDSATGPLLADWGYDTISGTTASVLGQQVKSTSYVGGAAYGTSIDGFTDLYQPTGETITIPSTETGIAGTYSYAFGYTAAGSDLSTTLPALGGLPREKLTTGYNTLGEADTLKTNVSATGDDIFVVNGTGYTRYGELGLVSRRNGDGPWLDTAYDYEVGTRRLVQIHTTRQTTPSEVADVHLAYDASGNVVKEQETTAGDTQCFGYDHARRLTDAWTPASADCAATRSQSQLGGPAPYWNSYTFDAVGNRTASTERTAAGSVSRSYAYPAARSAQPHALQSMTTSGAGAATYTYDKDGNTLTRPANGTSGAGQNLTWNPDGTLAANADAGGTATYVYDAAGNRIIKHEPSGTTLSLPGQELRVAGGQVTATRYLTHAGRTVAVRTAAGLTWQVDDQQGTGTVEVNATTQAVVKRWLTPFGAERGGAALWVTDKGLVGGTRDGSGLTHLGAREYDPTTGRFISVDPVFADDDPQQMQGYNYANANPVTMSDADGRMYMNTVDSMGPIRKPSKKALEQAKHTKPYADPRWDSRGRPRHQPVYQHHSSGTYQHYSYKPPSPTLSLRLSPSWQVHLANPCSGGYNSGFTSPAACEDGWAAYGRLKSGKSQWDAMAKHGQSDYAWNVPSQGSPPYSPIWRLKAPDLPAVITPMNAVAAEESLDHPKIEFKKQNHGSESDGGGPQLFITLAECWGPCVTITLTGAGHVFIGGSVGGSIGPSVTLTIGANAEPMENMKDWGVAACANAPIGVCGQVGSDAKTGRPVAGGGVTFGTPGGSVQGTYSHGLGLGE